MLLPTPSSRNFDIFYAVEDRGQSLRGVAAEHGLSPGRVGEIVQQVQRWYEMNTPAWASELDASTRAMVAFRRHDDRMKVLYDHMITGFENVRGKPRESGSMVRFLNGAMRISKERFVATITLAKIKPIDRPLVDEIEPPVGVLAREDVAATEVEPLTPDPFDVKAEQDDSFIAGPAPMSAADCSREQRTAPWRAPVATPVEVPVEDDAEFQAMLAETLSGRKQPPTSVAPRKTKKQHGRAQQVIREILGAEIKHNHLAELQAAG
jgi:hypothetical protein